ncbi:hypothetical protein ATN84_02480 [Paramesorhizobium deserti]|uniref:Uncharacterized protein n=2 Tax=Paramesorhizobium deserti TaxID=1494590 RepID=A0A135HZN5_9HYPH|nr:hypothetical protein [Paramesorhizobium deserti]KXF78670.1 hypothetical protein ATN84_02480 [Paramesorhizobium deserti]
MTALKSCLPMMALAALLVGPDVANSQEAGRYTMEKTDKGYVRLDTRTGDVSVCAEQSGQMVCKMAADDRRAYEDDLASLNERVKKLEEQVAAYGKLPPVVRDTLPSEEEFEKTMSYMERFFRRFMDIVKSFDGGSDGANDPVPDRT